MQQESFTSILIVIWLWLQTNNKLAVAKAYMNTFNVCYSVRTKKYFKHTKSIGLQPPEQYHIVYRPNQSLTMSR